jgi:hypothetical protein
VLEAILEKRPQYDKERFLDARPKVLCEMPSLKIVEAYPGHAYGCEPGRIDLWTYSHEWQMDVKIGDFDLEMVLDCVNTGRRVMVR